jgi:signal transduction histidine kinase
VSHPNHTNFADADSRAKGAFVANISHEMRTPLAGIIGIARILLDGDINAEQRHQLNLLLESAEGLLHKVNDILELSHAEIGDITLEPAEFELSELFGSALRPMREQAREKGIDLTVVIDPKLPSSLHGDAYRLSQVLRRLVSNAIKFTPSGCVSIRAELAESNSNRRRAILARYIGDHSDSDADDSMPFSGLVRTLRFSVTDTGPGIKPEIIERLFNPFELADSSARRPTNGTGLGLSICRHIVELMGGEIWADSTPGEGSTFYFTAYCGIMDNEADTENHEHRSRPKSAKAS